MEAWAPVQSTCRYSATRSSVFGDCRETILLDKPGRTPSTLEYTTPIHDEKGATNVGALVGVLDLDAVFVNRRARTRIEQNDRWLLFWIAQENLSITPIDR